MFKQILFVFFRWYLGAQNKTKCLKLHQMEFGLNDLNGGEGMSSISCSFSLKTHPLAKNAYPATLTLQRFKKKGKYGVNTWRLSKSSHFIFSRDNLCFSRLRILIDVCFLNFPLFLPASAKILSASGKYFRLIQKSWQRADAHSHFPRSGHYHTTEHF